MVRLPALRSKVKAGVSEPGPDGIPPRRLLAELRAIVARCLEDAPACWHDVLVPALAQQGVVVAAPRTA